MFVGNEGGLINRLESFLSGIAGLLVGIMIVSVIRNGEINWEEIRFLITFAFLILLFKIGLSLYKK
ncbi:hypothetical protein [Halobacillus campisalis]|uniref:hypothetical protein n=1 Tax=Halobacillus campisalis TaxID=435909 RepID=UPI0036F42192